MFCKCADVYKQVQEHGREKCRVGGGGEKDLKLTRLSIELQLKRGKSRSVS